jgi:uncharacterized protein with HEPN domain
MPDRRAADRDAAFVQDIVDSCRAIETYARGKTLSDFSRDALLQDAVARRLFIIGEAAKSLTEDLRRRVPSVDWKNIARLRDKLGHHYWTIELEKVWEIVVGYVPPLRAALEKELPPR